MSRVDTSVPAPRDRDPQSGEGTGADRVAWHALSPIGAAERLGVDPAVGLSSAEALARRERVGENVLREAPPPPLWQKLVRQFQEIVIWILLAAAVISGLVGEWADAAAIAAIVIVNALIGFFQEERAMQALAALRRLSTPLARVRRDGQAKQLAARELVPGDRIELEAGDNVPADARLLKASSLRLQEAALTGESEPVAKTASAMLEPDTPLGDRINLVHAGTVVAAGHATAVVTATGMQTELGQIASLLERGEPEVTPLQRRLAELGRLLIVVCLFVVGVIFLLELWRGGNLWEVLLRAVSLAVAAVPEGLPAVVTLVLAIGLKRMVQRNALVRRLPSVETLGSVTVICSDKTGTLTRNEMTVRELVTSAARYAVSGTGYTPHGEFHRVGAERQRATVVPRHQPDLVRLLSIAGRCNNAQVVPTGDGEGWRVVGDPTEGALVVAAVKAGIDREDPDEPIVVEVPFDSERKRMSVVVRSRQGPHLLYAKGAPEMLLSCCTAEEREGQAMLLDARRRREILAVADEMASRALRVLACGWKVYGAPLSPGCISAADENDLVFAGLIGMIDPPRDEVRAAVRTCRAAGIRPVMITGDHPATALAIGRELGMADGPAGTGVLTGREVDTLSEESLVAVVPRVSVYARVSATHKLRVVQAWQQNGDVVAMTGDGVNDAPAVRAADIGIAMGITGTDVTKEASDMVLTDDNFASIVAAVEEGRGIYDNIQKFIHYLLSCNAGEVILMFVAAVAGWPAPLAAIQILWLNLVTDGLPALALGLEPPESDIMQRSPRPPRQPVIPLRRGGMILLHGGIVAAVAIATFWWAWRGDPSRLPHARTVTFCVASFSQLFFALGCRSDRQLVWTQGLTSNPALLLAILISGLLQVSVVMLPFAQPVFEVGTALGMEWFVVLGAALVPLTVIETCKLLVIGGGRSDGRLP
jgi:Ca2+-transporting ATPase